ncbi:MAG: hypothetical protein GY725_04270 [bacterium]|nr:hypothetical protein [bacterium]
MDTDYLYTVAEVSVALAGFAGLVTVLARRDDASSAQRDAHLLQSMLFVSLMVTAFSLFPRLPVSFGLAPQSGWRISSGVFFVAWLVYVIPSYRRFSAVSEEFTPGWRRVANLHFGMHGFVGVGLLLGVFGVWGDRSEAIYLSCLFMLLYQASYLFVRLFLRLLARSSS